MGLKFVDPPNVPPPAGNYRHLAVVPAGRRLLVLAGQIGNLSDGTIVEGLEAQYEQALVNINTIVASEGGTSEDIARITVFLVEKPDRPFAREVDKKHFPDMSRKKYFYQWENHFPVMFPVGSIHCDQKAFTSGKCFFEQCD